MKIAETAIPVNPIFGMLEKHNFISLNSGLTEKFGIENTEIAG